MNSGCYPDMQEPLFYTPSQTKKPETGMLIQFCARAEGPARLKRRY